MGWNQSRGWVLTVGDVLVREALEHVGKQGLRLPGIVEVVYAFLELGHGADGVGNAVLDVLLKVIDGILFVNAVHFRNGRDGLLV